LALVPLCWPEAAGAAEAGLFWTVEDTKLLLMAFAPTVVPLAVALYVLRQSEKIAASEIKGLR
jgi:hypothetical protein